MIEKDGGCPTRILLPYTGMLVGQGFALSRYTRNSTKHFSLQASKCCTEMQILWTARYLTYIKLYKRDNSPSPALQDKSQKPGQALQPEMDQEAAEMLLKRARKGSPIGSGVRVLAFT